MYIFTNTISLFSVFTSDKLSFRGKAQTDIAKFGDLPIGSEESDNIVLMGNMKVCKLYKWREMIYYEK